MKKWRDWDLLVKQYRNFIILIVLLLVFVGSLSFLIVKNRTNRVKTDKTEKIAAKEFIGKKLPDFKLIDSNGESFESSQLKNKPTIIIEWASWCPHCHKMLPIMNNMYKKHKKEINFVFINATGSNKGTETRVTAKTYIEKEKFEFPYYYDDAMAVTRTLKVDSVPTFFYINDKNIVEDVTVSEMSAKDMENKINQLIN